MSRPKEYNKPKPKQYPENRKCTVCGKILSIYNGATTCSQHSTITKASAKQILGRQLKAGKYG